MSEDVSRRWLLRSSGLAAAGAGLAGCLRLSQSEGGDGDSTATETAAPQASPDDEPSPSDDPVETVDEPTETATPDDDPENVSETVTVSGPRLLGPLMELVADRSRSVGPDVSVGVASATTTDAFQESFIPGDSPVTLATREMTDRERRACADNGFEVLEFRIATDLVVVLANNDTDWVDAVSVPTLAEIWGADTAPETWDDVQNSWPDEPIDLFAPARDLAISEYFVGTVLGPNRELRTDVETTTDSDVLTEAVSGNPLALAFGSFAPYAATPDRVKALALLADDEAYEPELDNWREYPLTRPVYAYLNASAYEQRPAVQEFAEFLLEAMTELPAEVGFVPSTEEMFEENRNKL